MTNISTNDWARLIELARTTAAEDMRISNALLSALDEINAIAQAKNIPETDIESISSILIESALTLTEHSKQFSTIIWKLVGAGQ